MIGLPSPAAALELLMRAKAVAGSAVTTFEMMPRMALEFVIKHMHGCRDPLAGRHDWYVLMELSSPKQEALADTCAEILQGLIESGTVEDVALAASLDQRQAFWRLRET